jgi:hypothetical protein
MKRNPSFFLAKGEPFRRLWIHYAIGSIGVFFACSSPPNPAIGGSGGDGAGVTSALASGVSATATAVTVTSSTGFTCQPASSGSSPLDACEMYQSHFNAKYVSCQISSQCPITLVPCANATQMTVDTCLDGCIANIDCGCLQMPSGADCPLKTAPYQNCVATCVSGG